MKLIDPNVEYKDNMYVSISRPHIKISSKVYDKMAKLINIASKSIHAFESDIDTSKSIIFIIYSDLMNMRVPVTFNNLSTYAYLADTELNAYAIVEHSQLYNDKMWNVLKIICCKCKTCDVQMKFLDNIVMCEKCGELYNGAEK